jgi:hypothetical protein
MARTGTVCQRWIRIDVCPRAVHDIDIMTADHGLREWIRIEHYLYSDHCISGIS